MRDERSAVSNDSGHKLSDSVKKVELHLYKARAADTKVSPVVLFLSPNFRTVELTHKLRLIMDKDIYGGVADSRPLSREKCHTSGLSEERETSEEKYTTGSI